MVVGESKDKILTEAMNILQFILIDSPGAPLKKKIIDSGICSDVEAQYDSSMRQPMFTIVAREANAEDQDKFNSIIEEQLKSYVKNGLDKLALEAALNNFEFRAKEASFGRFPKGLALGLDAFESWLYDDELVQDKFSVQNVYSYLRKGINENLLNPEDKTKGFFEELIERCILNNNHKAYITGVPSVGLNQKKDAELAKKMSQYKKTLSDSEIEKLIADTAHLKQYQTEPSTPQELATIPLLSIDDINKKVRPVVNTEEEVCGVKTIKHDIFTNGISYLDMYFRIDDLDFEDLSKAELLFELLKYVDTDEHTYNELSTLINLNTGGVVFTLGTMYREEGSFTYALCKVKTFDNKVNDGIDLINEVITTSHITDKKRIKEILSEIKAAGKNTLVEGGHVTARGRAGSYVMLTQKIMEALDGVDYYRFIDYVDKNLDDIYDELAQDLTRIYKKIFRKKSLIISYTSKNEVTALEEGLNRLLPRLSDDDVEDKQFNPVLEVKNEGFKTASKVQYVATAANFKKAGLEYTGALNVLQIIFSYDYLWINVRVKGGAYGAMCDFTRSGLAFMTSYRDPNLGETYQIYKNAADYVENFDCSDRDMVKYIIGTVAKMDAPLTPAMEGVFSFGCYISEITDEERQKSRDEVLSATQEKIRNLAPFVKVLSDSDVICAVGSEDKINESSELFKEITKLF